MRCKVSFFHRRWKRQTATSKRKASVYSPIDVSYNNLYTIVNGVTGRVNGIVRLEASPSLAVLVKLDKMYDGEFSQAVKADGLSDRVVILPTMS